MKKITDWNLIDWDTPTCIIMEMTGATNTCVCINRRKYAPHTIRKYHMGLEKMKDKAMEIDWSKSDIQIAKETGRPRSSVWKTRRILKTKF
jgi:hypothetical protein